MEGREDVPIMVGDGWRNDSRSSTNKEAKEDDLSAPSVMDTLLESYGVEDAETKDEVEQEEDVPSLPRSMLLSSTASSL
jgi:hypothetical protein